MTKLEQILEAIQPGGPKYEIPVTLPPVTTIIEISPETKQTIYIALAGALLLALAMRR